MMKDLLAIWPSLLTALIGGTGTYIWTKKRNDAEIAKAIAEAHKINTDTEVNEVDMLDTATRIWRELANDLRTEVNELKKAVNELREENTKFRRENATLQMELNELKISR